jgi:hypothetical protein
MDLLTAILTCSLYLADDGLVRAIAESTPEQNPAFVLDASVDLTQVDPPPPPKTADEALARTRAILARGGRPVLGLMQIPPGWLSAFGRELAEAFDPCTNIAVGTAMLAEFDAACATDAAGGRGGPRVHMHSRVGEAGARSATQRRCILRRYEQAIGLPDFAAVTTLELHVQRDAAPPSLEAPILFSTLFASGPPSSLLVRLTPAFEPVSVASSNPE